MTTPANDNEPRRLMTKTAAAKYCGVSAPTFRKWVAEGLVPGPVTRLKRFDRQALDKHLDRLSGLDLKSDPVENDLDKWIRENAAAS
jgi:excisionase family DNA binding protein